MNDKDKTNLIPIPCHQKWEDMGKDETMKEGHTARMCDECQHHIHDISDMSAKQIINLKTELSLKGQKLCGMVRQPAQSNVTRLQRFSLVCTMAMSPVALVACGGNPSYNTGNGATPPNKPSGYHNHDNLNYHGPAVGLIARPPLVVGRVAPPPEVAGIVTAPRIVSGMIALPPKEQ